MSNTILNSDLSTRLEERLNSLLTNHLKIKEPHLNDSTLKKNVSKTASVSMDIASGVGGFLSLGVGAVGLMVAGSHGIDLLYANLPEYAEAGKYIGGAALGGAFVGASVALSKLFDTVKEKINTKLGFTSFETTEENLVKIEKDLGVQFNKEDFAKIARSLDQSDIKDTMQKAVSNAKIKNK